MLANNARACLNCTPTRELVSGVRSAVTYVQAGKSAQKPPPALIAFLPSASDMVRKCIRCKLEQ